MSSTVEKNFSGFVKMVIGATGLVAMGAIVACGSFLKGFKEGSKNAKEASNDQSKSPDDFAEPDRPSSATEVPADAPVDETPAGSNEI
ncbi:MAG: hypothetical protein ACI4EG_03100 [Fusicatenibacter sp.]